MLRIKSNTRAINKTGLSLLCGALALLLIGLSAAAGLCAEVSPETARRVAEAKLLHHIALYGSWNGHPGPTVAESQPVHYDGQIVAYNFSVEPSGHILVAVDDAFSPIPLYSERSRFNPERAFDPAAIESWIVPELDQRIGALNNYRRSLALQRREPAQSISGNRIKVVWDYYRNIADQLAASVPVRTAEVPPRLTTAWGQNSPYNLQTPAGSTCAHTWTGCVATAWAQLMRYHRWPEQGIGSHSYPWNGTIISANFDVPYAWEHMPATLNNASSTDQKNAVAQLMFHAGVAAEMEYGCSASGSGAWANDVLDTYFNYKAMEFHQRSDFATAEEWFSLFKAELDADSPRPVIFSIFSAVGGHEVVVDGYRDDISNELHINFGWNGDWDAYYDVSSDDAFKTGNEPDEISWYVNFQFAVTRIEPNHDIRPAVSAGVSQTVSEGETVYLAGTVDDAVERYEWLQVGIGDSTPTVTILNRNTLDQAYFTAPRVGADTQLVFMLKATDNNRSVGFDKIAITVRGTGLLSSRSGGGGSSGGGCFITTLH
jgi:hypothetical protein